MKIHLVSITLLTKTLWPNKQLETKRDVKSMKPAPFIVRFLECLANHSKNFESRLSDFKNFDVIGYNSIWDWKTMSAGEERSRQEN
jgi:hypothetical protein